MIPSLNRKYGSRGNRAGQAFYIRKEYRNQEQQEIARIQNQQMALKWKTTPTDRYAIFYTFTFKSDIKQDNHNPLKPTCDLLKPGGVIWNDNRVLEENQAKRISINPYDQWFFLTIFRFKKQFVSHIPLWQTIRAIGHAKHDYWRFQKIPLHPIKKET
jgi:Holliday junction resolvase RusA-like endonuclease